MIQRTIQAGHRYGKKVAVCGEMASRPAIAALLVAMGLDALSVTPGSIPEVKRALASVEIKKIQDEVEGLLALGEAPQIQDALRRMIPCDES
jgi:phosphoenolpyruvate-protein kinase (PTS system EI component)